MNFANTTNAITFDIYDGEISEAFRLCCTTFGDFSPVGTDSAGSKHGAAVEEFAASLNAQAEALTDAKPALDLFAEAELLEAARRAFATYAEFERDGDSPAHDAACDELDAMLQEYAVRLAQPLRMAA